MKAYNVDGVSFGSRLQMIRRVLIDAIKVFEEASGLEDGEKALEIVLAIHSDMTRGFHEAIPGNLQEKLPWKTIINLINSGLVDVGWDFLGSVAQPLGPGMAPTHCACAAKKALAKVSNLHYCLGTGGLF